MGHCHTRILEIETISRFTYVYTSKEILDKVKQLQMNKEVPWSLWLFT
jgi:hypothetical protein